MMRNVNLEAHELIIIYIIEPLIDSIEQKLNNVTVVQA